MAAAGDAVAPGGGSDEALQLCVRVLRARGLPPAPPLGAVRCEAHWRGAAARTRGARPARRGDAAERRWASSSEPLRFSLHAAAAAAAGDGEVGLRLLLLNGARDALLGQAVLSERRVHGAPYPLRSRGTWARAARAYRRAGPRRSGSCVGFFCIWCVRD